MKACFLDLDGTLTDSRPGLYPSFQAGLKAIGIPALSDRQLARFLGTPLPEMFRTLKPDVSQAQIDIGIEAFRSVYESEGISKNRLYPGIVDMLKAIRDRHCATWIVTSKPEHYAIQVVRHLALHPYVAGVIGAGLDEKDTKTSLIRRALADAHAESKDVVMVGDRHYDITGALENDVLPVGALWGYGSYDELFGAGCRHFAQSPDEMQTLIVKGEFRNTGRSTTVLGHTT